jgi:hypothetical protein
MEPAGRTFWIRRMCWLPALSSRQLRGQPHAYGDRRRAQAAAKNSDQYHHAEQ